MPESVVLHAQPRTVIGKKVRRLRVAGLTPIVIYGNKTEPIALQVNTKQFVQVINQVGATQLISVEVEGESEARNVLVRDYQHHVTRFTPLHADLIEVDMKVRIQATVPVHVTANPPLVDQNEAILTMSFNELTVEALPAMLPQSIDIDASGLLTLDDVIKLEDIDLGDGAEIIGEPDTVIISLNRRRAEEVDEVEDDELEDGELADGAIGEAADDDEGDEG
jgi:large subunit ribosomal protein L25